MQIKDSNYNIFFYRSFRVERNFKNFTSKDFVQELIFDI